MRSKGKVQMRYVFYYFYGNRLIDYACLNDCFWKDVKEKSA